MAPRAGISGARRFVASQSGGRVRKADIISGGLVALFGLALLLVIIPIWVPTILEGSYGLRAKDMPNVATVTVTALAVFLVLSRIRVGKTKADATPPISRENWWFLVRGAVFLTVVTALFVWIGFLAAGPVTVAGFMLMMGERRPIPIGITAIGAPVIIWLFFWQLLRFPLP